MSDAHPPEAAKPAAAAAAAAAAPADAHGVPPEAHEESKGEKAKKMAAEKAAKAAEAAKAGLKKVKNLSSGLLGTLKETVVSLVSLPLLVLRGSLGTKLITIGFLASVALLATTAAKLYHHYFEKLKAAAKTHTKESEAADQVAELARKQKELQVSADKLLFLERFSSQLVNGSGDAKFVDLEAYIETDEPETRTLLKSHMEELREIVGTAIQGQAYDKLMTDEGKEALKGSILEAINTHGLHKWNSQGAVKRVFFTRFVLGG